MSKVHEIDGIKYREVNRKAEVGDKVVVIGRLPEDTSDLGRQVEAKIGHIYNMTNTSCDSELIYTDGKWRDGSRLNLVNGEYRVLEPITDADVVEATANDASDRILDMLGNLAVRLTELERKVSDLDSGYNALCTELSEIEDTVEMLTDDIVTLDERTQGLTEPVDSSEIDDLLSDINGTNIDLLLNDVADRLADRIYTSFLRAGGR